MTSDSIDPTFVRRVKIVPKLSLPLPEQPFSVVAACPYCGRWMTVHIEGFGPEEAQAQETVEWPK